VTVGMGSVGIALFLLVCRLLPVIVVEERAPAKLASRPFKAAAGG
jgi:hypothetical protein